MSKDILVSVENVSKRFCRNLKQSLFYGVQDVVSDLVGLVSGGDKLRKGEFWANKEVSFKLKRGECLGLIGHNGAGKTTLLKMLNGLIKPDDGRISIKGRVGALIALGAGFNPILTGRENVYIAGSVLGMRKGEIDSLYDEIVDFAELDDFMESPVQNYSSGMQVRLGFSVATSLKPDVLLLDEVLAVGDASFRNKCYKRISKLREGAAVIFVSHSMPNVARMCDRALVLDHGEEAFLGEVEDGVAHYERLGEKAKDGDAFSSAHDPLQSIELRLDKETITSGESLTLLASVKSSRELSEFTFRLVLYNASGDLCACIDCASSDHGVVIRRGENQWMITVPGIFLRRGKFPIGVNILSPQGDILAWSYKQVSLNVRSDSTGLAVDFQPVASAWEIQ